MYLFQQRFPQGLGIVSCVVKERKKDFSHGEELHLENR